MSFDPKNITRDHVLSGVEIIEQENIDLIPSTRWLVEINGKKYPPKEVMRAARVLYDKSEEWPYGGGHPTNKFLERMGFEIIDKADTNPVNVKKEFGIWLLKNAPDSYRQYLGKTFSEVEGRLTEINQYFKERDIYEVHPGKIEDLINYLNIKTNRKEREKNREFAEYDKFHSNGIPKAILRGNNYPRFLREKFNKSKTTNPNYWIFQCNPAIYDLEEALKNDAVNSWKVAAHKDKIKPGDKAIIWVTGSDAKCLALGEVISKPDYFSESDQELEYYLNNENSNDSLKVQMKITYNLVANPIYWDEIIKLPEFQNFKAGNQGTNFSATKEEYQKLIQMASNSRKKYWIYSPGENAEFWEEFYRKGIMGLGWDYLGDLRNYDSKEAIISKMQEVEETDGSKKNDATACDDFCYNMNIGDIVIAKKGRSTLIGYGTVVSDYYYDNERETFHKLRKVQWQKKGEWNAGVTLVLKTLTDITRYPSKLPEYDHYYERLLAIIDEKVAEPSRVLDLPLNCILYGPPGTGKTFKLQNEYFDDFSVKETSLSRSQYLENIILDLTWWQVLSIILLDIKKSKVHNITGHELLAIKGKLSNSKTVRPTVWGRLQAHSKLECPNVNVADRSQPAIFYKDEESFWTVDKELLEQYYPEAFTILEQVRNFKPNDDKLIKNYEFVTFHQSFSYEDFIEGIKPKLEDQENEVSYEIQDGIFKKLCLKADADRENNYAIFIDEINRGNVSAIFGELITLIEHDKRLGEKNELRAKLPYSKKELGVPPNLHIFGTMNTADRSVEALDTALRRRFSFEEVMPIPELLEDIGFDSFNLGQVLKVINDRIEALLDRDHTIGHSYFISILPGDTEALRHAFENKVIPLLQEYFYHDYEKIALILGEGFVTHKEANVNFARFKNVDQPELSASFELKMIHDIEKAIRILLNNKDEESQ